MINRGGLPGQGVDRAGGVARAGLPDDPPEPGLDIYGWWHNIDVARYLLNDAKTNATYRYNLRLHMMISPLRHPFFLVILELI